MILDVRDATDQSRWDNFLIQQRFRPFLQSWTMGEVYAAIGQEPVRLEVTRDDGTLVGICFAHIVPARRGRHLSIPYGPVVNSQEALPPLLERLTEIARTHRCSFIRMSPFWPANAMPTLPIRVQPSPLHLLAEHLWYVPLNAHDSWSPSSTDLLPGGRRLSEDELQKDMRSTTRNLIRRAQKEGVVVHASADPVTDLAHFLRLHEETRARHGFTPYSNAFFRAQVAHFARRGECTLYLAEYAGQIIASSIHMHVGGETSYHHGASTHQFSKIPASYLLQWTAIQDALRRGDHVYNFWGIAPQQEDAQHSQKIRHPFAGVTLFKTGFGGKLLTLAHCIDLPLSWKYRVTRGFEQLRKWKRGF